MPDVPVDPTAAALLLQRLCRHRIAQLFVNGGTDFPPLIEAYAQARARGVPVPRAVVCPHEQLALGMAHGHHLISGRPQAAMLHTNVGLANGVLGLLNAHSDRVPLLLMSGRTPYRERGHAAARTLPIGWGQEMRDQAGLVREACKWEHELRVADQAGLLVDRALAVAGSTPKGPVYLALPREPLADAVPEACFHEPVRQRPVVTAPDPAAVEEAAELLAAARRPLVIAARGPTSRSLFDRFARWLAHSGAAACSYWASRCAFPTDHPAHVGSDPEGWVERADVVLVIDTLAPWVPLHQRPAASARVIQLAPDPLFAHCPLRGFPVDVGVGGELELALSQLLDALEERGHATEEAWRERRLRAHRALVLRCTRNGRAARGRPERLQLSRLLGELLAERPSSLFSELGADYAATRRRDPLAWFKEPPAGGLGWSFPAALGAKLADPERDVVAVMGDGSYLFANPEACLRTAAREGLAVLAVVVDNGCWGTVRQAVRELYPEGEAIRSNAVPMTDLGPRIDLTAGARAHGAFAARVEAADALRPALEAALRAVREGQPALVQVLVEESG